MTLDRRAKSAIFALLRRLRRRAGHQPGGWRPVNFDTDLWFRTPSEMSRLDCRNRREDHKAKKCDFLPRDPHTSNGAKRSFKRDLVLVRWSTRVLKKSVLDFFKAYWQKRGFANVLKSLK